MKVVQLQSRIVSLFKMLIFFAYLALMLTLKYCNKVFFILMTEFGAIPLNVTQ